MRKDPPESQSRRWFIKAGIQHKAPLANTLDIPSKGFNDNLLKPQIPSFALGTESKSLICGRQNNLVSHAARADSCSRLLTHVVRFQYQFEISIMECMQHVDDSLSPRLDRH